MNTMVLPSFVVSPLSAMSFWLAACEDDNLAVRINSCRIFSGRLLRSTSISIDLNGSDPSRPRTWWKTRVDVFESYLTIGFPFGLDLGFTGVLSLVRFRGLGTGCGDFFKELSPVCVIVFVLRVELGVMTLSFILFYCKMGTIIDC